MVDLICADSQCKKTISGNLIERKIRCPYCGSKALKKRQDRISNSIKAI